MATVQCIRPSLLIRQDLHAGDPNFPNEPEVLFVISNQPEKQPKTVLTVNYN